MITTRDILYACQGPQQSSGLRRLAASLGVSNVDADGKKLSREELARAVSRATSADSARGQLERLKLSTARVA